MLKRLSAFRLSLYDTSGHSVSNARYVPDCQRTRHRLQRQAASNLVVCAVSSRVCPREQMVVGLGGLEPPASPLSGVRSNHLSYRPPRSSRKTGGAYRDRTDDPLLAKQVLSQLSYGPDVRDTLWMQVTCADVWTGN